MGRFLRRLRAVIFDWGGTLTPWHSFDLAEQWQVFARQVVAEEEEAASLAARLVAAEAAAYDQVRPLWVGLRERGIRVGVLSNTIWPGDYHRGVFERDGVLDLIDADVYYSDLLDVLDIVHGWQSP